MAFLDSSTLKDGVSCVGFEPCDEEDLDLVHPIEELIVVVGAVHDVSPPFLEKVGEEFSIVHSTHGEDQFLGNGGGEVEQEVSFAGVDVLSVRGP